MVTSIVATMNASPMDGDCSFQNCSSDLIIGFDYMFPNKKSDISCRIRMNHREPQYPSLSIIIPLDISTSSQHLIPFSPHSPSDIRHSHDSARRRNGWMRSWHGSRIPMGGCRRGVKNPSGKLRI